VLGSSSTDAIGPGSVFRLMPPWLMYIWFPVSTGHILLAGLFYIVQDCFSKLIVGLYVGLEDRHGLEQQWLLQTLLETKSLFAVSMV